MTVYQYMPRSDTVACDVCDEPLGECEGINIYTVSGHEVVAVVHKECLKKWQEEYAPEDLE